MAIRVSSLENSLFNSVSHFLIGLFDFLNSNFLSSLYILDTSPLLDIELGKIFSKYVVCHFDALTVSFAYWSFSILWGSICWLFILEYKTLVFCSRNFPLCPGVWGSSPLSLLLISVYLVLCGSPWSTWTGALYKEIRMD